MSAADPSADVKEAIDSGVTAGPLRGLRVVDFTRVFSGPFATQILADFGATVTKVERVDGGDEARDYGHHDEGESMGAPFLAMNRNKRSVCVDLTHEAGRQIATELAARADVLVENFRPGVMDRLGLGYEQLSATNPRLVYCSITGFGGAGPLRARAANDLSLQALSGLLSFTGPPEGPPCRTPAPLADLAAGMFGALGIQAALTERAVTGRGQRVETSMLGAQLNTLGYFFADYWLHDRQPGPMGTANELGLPNQAFPTSDGWVCITASNERAWRRLCTALEVPEAAEDPRFRDLRARYRHREDVVTLITERTASLTLRDCVARLDEHGVSNSPMRTLAEAAAEPQLADHVTATEVPGLGTVRLVGSPVRFGGRPLSATAEPPPALGADTPEVLGELGYTEADIRALNRVGTIAGEGMITDVDTVGSSAGG
jgi:crotonobetainyl-CoA:carnitine CoA-transferase CaiB-like acyl-CoA transferase